MHLLLLVFQCSMGARIITCFLCYVLEVRRCSCDKQHTTHLFSSLPGLSLGDRIALMADRTDRGVFGESPKELRSFRVTCAGL